MAILARGALLVAAVAGPAASAAWAPAPARALVAARDPSVEQAVASAAGDPLTVRLITVGPGDAVWEQFGHNALWIHDRAAGTDIAYNWGIFDFDQVGFFARLVRGTMLYSMAPFPARDMMRLYASRERAVHVQELALSPAQEAELRAFVRWNSLPRNRDYLYDYYRDNCSTRVRDALDRVLDGALRQTLADTPTGTTYRWHTRRLLQDMPAAYGGIELVLSERADQPIDRWQESFLPLKLMEHLRDVRVPDGEGGARALVVSTRTLHPSSRPPPPRDVAFQTGWWLLVGVTLAALLVSFAGASASGRAPPRVAVAALGGLWAFASGVAGVVLLGAWLFTDHVFWYGNENLLQTSPLALLLVPLLAPLGVRRRPGRVALGVAAVVAALSLVGFAVQALPGMDQVNREVVALALPANLGLALALWRLRRDAAGHAATEATR